MNSENISENQNPFLNQNDKGSDTIVFQIGSHSIKFGLASQNHPFIIPNVIAYYNKHNSNINESFFFDEESFNIHLTNIEQEITKNENNVKTAKKLAMLNAAKNQVIKNTNLITEIPERISEQLPYSTTNYKRLQSLAYDLNEDIIDNNFKFTNVNDNPKILVGIEALCIPETKKNEYKIRFPIKYGFFNEQYSAESVLNDIENIIIYCVSDILKINIADYNKYNIVLIIPDVFIKMQVKLMVNVFLKNLEFKNIFLHLESVLSTFGLALQSALVVDIGSTKINICCIEEGIILEDSIIRKNIGGDDITKMLFLMIKNSSKIKESNSIKSFPYELININNIQHFRIMEKLKENECEFPDINNLTLGINNFTQKNTKIWIHSKGNNTKVISFTLTDSAYVSSLCLFFPEIISSFRNQIKRNINFYNDLLNEKYDDPEDVVGEMIKTFSILDKKEENNSNRNQINNLSSNISNLKDSTSNNLNNSPNPSICVNSFSSHKNDSIHNDDSDSMSHLDEQNNFIDDKINIKHSANTYESLFDLSSGLDDLICECLMKVSSSDLRKKFANSIILVGGCAKIKGFIDYLEDRLIEKISLLDKDIERVEVLNFPGVDAKAATWIGGSVIPKLDSSKEMWIQKERWCGEPEKIEDNKDKENKDTSNNNIKDDTNTKSPKNSDANSDNQHVNDDDNNNNNSDTQKNDGKTDATKTNKKKANDKETTVRRRGVDRHLDGGVKLIREKCPFSWN